MLVGEGGELLVVVVVVLRLGPGQRNQNALVELFLGDGPDGWCHRWSCRGKPR